MPGVYTVTYLRIYPGADRASEEDNTAIAFVLADSFADAEKKVYRRFNGELESVSIRAISRDDAASIVV